MGKIIDKLNYLKDTKNLLKNSINQDFNTITNDTTFREYAKALNDNIDKLKEFIPTNVVSGKETIIEDAVPLKPKELKVYGNSHQESTKGINLFNYLENIGSVTGLDISADDDYIVINGTTNNDYLLIIKDIDLTDILEDGSTYTLWQEDNTKSSSSSTFPKMAIRLHRKDKDDNSTYVRTTASKIVTFKVDKAAYSKYFVDVVTPVKGEVYSDYRNRFMVLKGEYTEGTIPKFEPYTGGMASPNPDYPQIIKNINSIFVINSGKNLLPYPYTTTQTEINGVNIEYLNGGGVILNGITTAQTDIHIGSSTDRIYLEKDQTYTLTKNANVSSGINLIWHRYTTETGTTTSDVAYLNPNIFEYTYTTSSEDYGYRFLIRIQKGASLDNVMVKPILAKGESPSEFEAYRENIEFNIPIENEVFRSIDEVKDELIINANTGDIFKNQWIRHLELPIEDMNNSNNYPGWANVSYIKNDYPNINSPIKSELNFISNIVPKNESGINMNTVDCSIIFLSKTVFGEDHNEDFWKANYPNLIFEFDYVMPQSELIKIGTLTQEELAKLKLFEGTNDIKLVSNLGTEMQLEYYKDYKANSLDEVSE